MTDRLTDAFNLLRQGGAVFAGPARITGWNESPRGMTAAFRLDCAEDKVDNPPVNPFRGCHASPKDGAKFMVLVIPVADGEPTPAPAEPRCDAAEPVESAPVKPGRKWSELPISQRAALLCNTPAFWVFLTEEWRRPCANAEEAARHVRDECGVSSRADLNNDPHAARLFGDLYDRYQRWNNQPVEGICQ